MVDSDSNSDEATSSSILAELTTKMTEVLNRASAPSQIGSDHTVAPIGIKLDGSNYPLWSQVVKMYISGKDKLGYINGDLLQPPQTDPTSRRWRTDNAIVKGWIINSMDSSLISNFIRFSTAKLVWDAIATTYFDGSDTSQVYDLRRRVTRLKQAGGSLEKYYNDLQGLWREIDFCRPNPMTCQVDIQHYNTLVQEERVYVFLDGLDDRLDNIRSDVLQMKPFPTVEQAYAHVRREALRQAVMTDNSNELSGAVLASKGLKLQSSKIFSQSKHKEPSNGTKCSHCGGNKHTSETCFKLHGYPDWWTDFQARKCRDTTESNPGKAAVATAEPHLSLILKSSSHTTEGNVLICSNHDDDSNAWILDSGATDHMTFDAADFSKRSTPRRSSIANANGGLSAVTGAGTVMLSPSLLLSNTLLVPSLSHKLLSVSQVTKDLNCVVLIYPSFCFLQDILTKEIIGCGTKRGGLYYMEDFSVGRAHHMHYPRNNKMEQVLLWHRRLDHPSLGYLKHVFPNLFSYTSLLNFKCEACILAKSHRVTFPLSMNKSNVPFALIHSDVWGPSPKSSISGYQWFVIFVDDCT